MARQTHQQKLMAGIYDELKIELRRTPTLEEIQDKFNQRYGRRNPNGSENSRSSSQAS